MALQRNAIVPPFSVRTPFLQKGNGNMKKSGQVATENGNQSGGSDISFPHVKFLQSVEQGLNNSVQLGVTVPASSTSPGEPGTIVLGINTIYVCTGPNVWSKFVGAPF